MFDIRRAGQVRSVCSCLSLVPHGGKDEGFLELFWGGCCPLDVVLVCYSCGVDGQQGGVHVFEVFFVKEFSVGCVAHEVAFLWRV